MGRSEITAGLSTLLERQLEQTTCVWGREVSIEALERCRPDYLSVSANFGKFAAVSSIERAEVTVYEIKSCLADFKSGHGVNEIGDNNWLVMPYETLMKIIESEGEYSIGRWSVAYPFPEEHGRVPDIANLPTYEGQVDGWKLYWGVKDLSRKTRPMPIMVYLWALLHSVNSGVSAMPNLYHFPSCTKAEQNFLDHQVRKVEEEADELWDEIAKSPQDDARILEETWDVIHACEGILRKYTIAEVYAAMKNVEAKNQARGYYGGDKA